MRFEEAYTGWQAGRLTQEEAARILAPRARGCGVVDGAYDPDVDALVGDQAAERSASPQARHFAGFSR
jgi:hypothetical protein